MGISGQDKLFGLFFLGHTSSPCIAAHCAVGEGIEQRNNKSSENKHKEPKGTKKETDMRNSERNQTRRECVRGSSYFLQYVYVGYRCLAVLLCIVKVFAFSELYKSLSLLKCL